MARTERLIHASPSEDQTEVEELEPGTCVSIVEQAADSLSAFVFQPLSTLRFSAATPARWTGSRSWRKAGGRCR